jgi:hypothetical protein
VPKHLVDEVIESASRKRTYQIAHTKTEPPRSLSTEDACTVSAEIVLPNDDNSIACTAMSPDGSLLIDGS